MFKDADPLLLNAVIRALHPVTTEQNEIVISQGDIANEMYFICRGNLEVIDDSNNAVHTLSDGDFFGEIGILMSTARTATVKAKTRCDLFMLSKTDFSRILQDHPQFAQSMMGVAKERYDVTVSADELMGSIGR